MDTPDKKAFVVEETRALDAPEPKLAIVADETIDLDKALLSSSSSQATQCKPGETFAERYEVMELLGKGGTGAVYRVRHLHLEKFFALKILYATDGNQADTIRRFQQEAKFGTRLDHPGIVRVHDFGVQEGKPYMVMDLLNGESLSALIKKKELSQERLLKVFGVILNALAHAHDKSIIHRDIKPGNILVGTDGNGEDQVTLVDLGIAKELDRKTPQDMSLTKTGEIFGTPLYMSPEQCCGTPVDTRSDIYSVGCLMYEALTGSPPFSGETVFEIINKHINEAPPPFPAEIRNTKLGARLEAVVLKALAKNKQHRYQFALEMASELKQLELHQGSAITDMKLYWKLCAGRMNAVQRATALSSWLMCFLSVCAILMSSLIFYLRPQIETEFEEVKRNAIIVRTLSATTIGPGHSLDKRKITLMQKKIAQVKRQSQIDPKQLELVDRFEKDYKAAEATTSKFVNEAQHSFETMSISTLRDLFENLSEISDPWATVSHSRSVLYANSFQKYKQNADQLSICLFLFSLLPWLGTACDLALLVLIVQRLKSGQETKRAYDKALKDKQKLEQVDASS